MEYFIEHVFFVLLNDVKMCMCYAPFIQQRERRQILSEKLNIKAPPSV